jgi:microcin C transport system substrate-binding protein
MKKILIFALAGLIFNIHAEKSHAIARYGKPAYAENMQHFSYVNPNAPRGGILRLSTVGNFDSIHPYTIKGSKAEGLVMLLDPLMYRNSQEVFTLYGCIAQYAEITADNSSITFYINPEAKFDDSHAITAEDVKFSYEYLLEQGLPRHKHYYSKIEKIEIIDSLTIKLTLKKDEDGTYNAELPFNMSLLLVLPKHYLEGKKIDEIDWSKMPVSGAYKIGSYDIGHSIEYVRNEKHWSDNLPIFKGMNNFEKIRIDYYKTTQAQFLAFQAGEFDVFFETNPNAWETGYNFDAAINGRVKKVDSTHERPVAVKTIIYNMRKPIFDDWRVRKAIALAFDFDTLNKMLFANSMQPTDSLFANTYLAPKGKASPKVETVLEEFKNKIPSELYYNMIETGFLPARTKGQGDQRENLAKAAKLLEDAGWKIINGVRTNNKNEILKIELMYKDPKLEKIVLALQASLQKLGVQLSPRMMDNAQYENRVLDSTFDMIIHTWANGLCPGNEQLFFYSRKMADTKGSTNYIGMKDEIAEKLALNVATSKTIEDLTTNAHALDRYIMNMHYQIPLFYDNKSKFAYWIDKLAFPEIDPKVGTNVMAYGWHPENSVTPVTELKTASTWEKIKTKISHLLK